MDDENTVDIYIENIKLDATVRHSCEFLSFTIIFPVLIN